MAEGIALISTQYKKISSYALVYVHYMVEIHHSYLLDLYTHSGWGIISFDRRITQ